MRGRTWIASAALAVTVLAGPAWGGDPPAAARSEAQQSRIEKLERQLQALTEQLRAVQGELAALKKEQQEAARRAEAEKLRQAAVAEAASTKAPEAVDTTTQFVSGTRMQPQLNPEISVVGDLWAVGGNHQQEEFQARHFELDIQSYLDPYTKMHVVIGYHGPGREPEFGLPPGEVEHHHEGFGLGEGYITWLHVPGGLTVTLGKKRQQFGVLNRWHLHALDQADLPWVLAESFGEHGLVATGVSVDWLMPRLWAHVNELTVEVTDGDNGVAFAGGDWKHPTFVARLKSYWDLSESSYLEVGLDGAHGNADPDGHLAHDFWAVDATYDWYPAGRELYREFRLRGMLLHSTLERPGMDDRDAWGGSLYGQLKFSPHWIAGLRFDRVDDQREPGRYWGLTPYLTFWESEFVRLRAQASYRKDDRYGIDRSFLLQVTFAAGPHKHDSY